MLKTTTSRKLEILAFTFDYGPLSLRTFLLRADLLHTYLDTYPFPRLNPGFMPRRTGSGHCCWTGSVGCGPCKEYGPPGCRDLPLPFLDIIRQTTREIPWDTRTISRLANGRHDHDNPFLLKELYETDPANTWKAQTPSRLWWYAHSAFFPMYMPSAAK